jgi:hypothetical protein
MTALLTYTGSILQLLEFQGIIIVELHEDHSLEQADPNLVPPLLEPCRNGHGSQLIPPRELAVLMLRSVPSCKGVYRSLEIRCKLERPAFHKLRVSKKVSGAWAVKLCSAYDGQADSVRTLAVR